MLQSWEVLNTAVLTGRQVSQAMKVFIVSRAGKVADVTLQASCRSVEESVLKVCKTHLFKNPSVWLQGSRGNSLASLARAGVYMYTDTHTPVSSFSIFPLAGYSSSSGVSNNLG